MKRWGPHYFLTLLLLSATLAASVWSDHRAPVVLAKPIDSIGTQIDGWTSAGNQQLRDRVVASLKATNYLSRTYRKDRNTLDLFVAGDYAVAQLLVAGGSPTVNLGADGIDGFRQDHRGPVVAPDRRGQGCGEQQKRQEVVRPPALHAALSRIRRST